MLRTRYRAASQSRDNAAVLLPPNLRTLGAQSFTAQDRETLRAWLAEVGWPRNTMDVTTLEGYLVALLVWPVGVPCGAWLPPIWGESGWKVPAKIASPSAYAKFIGLIVGFLQHLDHELSSFSPQLAPMTLSTTATQLRGQSTPYMSWARGFLRALQQNSQGLQWRSSTSRSAVACIARHASSTAPLAGAHSHSALGADLTSAVAALAAERSSRGPLGVLESRSSGADLLEAAASRDSDSSARGHQD